MAPATGPGSKSMFGKQPLGGRQSAPSFGFGTGTREHFKKQYASKEQAASDGVQCSPGAVYEVKSGIGKQVNSRNASTPSYGFGSQGRFGKDTRSSKDAPGPGTYRANGAVGKQVDSTKTSMPTFGFGTGSREKAGKMYQSAEASRTEAGLPKNSPGPGAYTISSGLGKQAASNNETAPMPRFGTEDRFGIAAYPEKRRAKEVPGAGAYNIGSGVGRQVLGGKTSYPAFGFGTGKRDKLAKLYLSAEAAKSEAGLAKNSPGPGAYQPNGGLGKQVSSKNETAPMAKFGTDTRFKDDNPTKRFPGPGTYCI